MKKILCLVLAALLLLSLAACSENEPGTETAAPTGEPAKTDAPVSTGEPAKTEEPLPSRFPSPEEIEAAVAEAVGAENYLAVADVPEDELWSCVLADADMDKIDSYVAKVALVTALNMDTVVVAKCKDAAYANDLVKIFQKGHTRIMDYVKQYPFNVPKSENARIYKVGNLVMLILAGADPDAEATEEEAARLAQAEYEKIDNALRELFGMMPENLNVH